MDREWESDEIESFFVMDVYSQSDDAMAPYQLDASRSFSGRSLDRAPR